MGTSASERREELEAMYLKKQLERQIEIDKIVYERKLKQLSENIDRQNEMRYKKITQDIQNSLDNKRRKHILKLQHSVGYNLDPYKMSSSELKYWLNKIHKEIERKLQSQGERLNNIYNDFNNNYNYFYKFK